MRKILLLISLLLNSWFVANYYYEYKCQEFGMHLFELSPRVLCEYKDYETTFVVPLSEIFKISPPSSDL